MKGLRYPIVAVRCDDQTFTTSCVDDRNVKDLSLSPMVIVGHLVHEDEEAVRVAHEYFYDYDVRYITTIPRKTIVEMEVLVEPEKD